MAESNFEQKLVAAYDKMLERVHDFWDSPEINTAPTLQQRIALARERAVELQEVTADEADKVATYIERDLNDAAHYMHDSGQTFSNWFSFDLQLIEQRMLDMFASVADKTRLELAQLARQAKQAQRYYTGEVTGIGQLTCESCGNALFFERTDTIPACPACNQTTFQRQSAN